MSLNRIPEPWGALTSEIDAGAKCEAELHCPEVSPHALRPGASVCRSILGNRAATSPAPEVLTVISHQQSYVAMRHVVTQPEAIEAKPLTEPVLLSLADKPRHGYVLMSELANTFLNPKGAEI